MTSLFKTNCLRMLRPQKSSKKAKISVLYQLDKENPENWNRNQSSLEKEIENARAKHS